MAARVGLFLCQGDQPAETAELGWSVKADGKSGPVFRTGHPDTKNGAADLIRLIQENGLTGFVAAACPPLKPEGLFFRELGRAGLDPAMGLYLDLGAEEKLEKYLAEPGTQLALTQALAAQTRREVARPEPFQVSTGVLVVGGNLSALMAAKELAGAGYQVTLLSPDKDFPTSSALMGPEGLALTAELAKELQEQGKVGLMSGARMKSLRGAVGRFTAFCVDDQSATQSLEVGAVVVAQGAPLKGDFATFGVAPSQRVLPLSQAAALDQAGLKSLASGSAPLRVALCAGVGVESDPLNLRASLAIARQVVGDLGGQALVLTGNAKVAAPDLEQLMEQAKKDGVLIAKLTEPKASAQDKGGSVALTFYDEILGAEVAQELDLLVVDEAPAPDPAYAALARGLGLAVSPDGSLQPDQVNALPIMTPKKGVFTIGPAQGRVDLEERKSQAKAAAMAVRGLLRDGSVEVAPPVEIIDTGKCAVCLTCVRVCPEGAMITDLDKPASNPLACTGCGTCASECPQDAIRMLNQSDEVFSSQISAAKSSKNDGSAPEMLVFVCANSAAQAISRARREGGWSLPAGVRLLQVPCASKIDPAFVLQAFSEGFDGVLVLSCFEDACFSLAGNTWLGYRAGHLQNLLTEAGVAPERIRRAGVAPSMKQEPTALIEAMSADLAKLGPAGLRPAHRAALERFNLELGGGLSVTP